MEQIWWQRVPNTLLFISDIVNNLLSEKSIVLTCSGEFPWYSFMRQEIKDNVKHQNSSKSFDNVSDVNDPGDYLFREFCKKEKRAVYRPSKTYAKFLAESDDIVLHDRYLWVKVENKSQLGNWMDFVSAYVKERGKNKVRATFILEWIGCDYIQPKKGIAICSLDDYISEYDRKVFCTLSASSIKAKIFYKHYLTELATNIVGDDMELCAACLVKYDAFMQDPYVTIQSVLIEEVRNDGTYYFFDKTESDVRHLIWLSQIKSIYPALEEYREIFVQRFASAIEKHLPITTSYGETYNDPKDVELGTLKYMADNGLLDLKQNEYEQLKIYKDARNRLSHLTPLSMEEIKKLNL